MDFFPPINERTNKELLNIISNDDEWQHEIQILAEEELRKRNLSLEFIASEKRKRISLLEKVRNRKATRLAKNKSESYSFTEMIVIALFFPVILLWGRNPLSDFAELDAGNYRKKTWQRIVLIVLSLLIWLGLLKIFL